MKEALLKKRKLIVLILCMLAAGICYSCSSSRPEGEIVLELGQEEEISAVSDREEENTEQTAALIWVHVCGCVNNPGVYAVPEGSRLYEAVEAAGGCSEEGAADFLNLAMKAEDGMRLEVPSISQAERWKEEGSTAFSGSREYDSQKYNSQKSDGRVNLNTAGREELMTLNGIGASRAEAIIRYREENGGFSRIEDVMNVSGIKEGAFEKIKDSITV
ncbi:MAG: helix-hairpin-helix domain-containing protein [Enterocloster sp.]